MRSGITRRWLRGNLLLTVLLLVLVEGMFLYSYTRSYYNGVQQTMVRRFSSITGQLKMYTGDTAQKASASRSVALRRMVEQFSDKDKYEFMLLDSYGGVIASSSGTDADGIVIQSDFEQAQDAVDGKVKPEEIDEHTFDSYLDTAGIPDPDLMIRTSGELRLSNFLLWQMAYTEFYFTEVAWPDFNKAELIKAIEKYNQRDRRYGGVKEE